MDKKIIYIYENWSDTLPIKLGKLYVESTRGGDSYAFEYDDIWLIKISGNLLLDPDLELYRGRQYPINKHMFGLFSDCAPDRWGRILMKKREQYVAQKENRKPRDLSEIDYLLGVDDRTRMGALRFSVNENGPFLNDDSNNIVPPWVKLQDLEEASRGFEMDRNSDNEKWLNQLIQPGSSLGGARPKATVEDNEGSLWIAKFPSKHDDVDVGAWEKVTHEMARLCGLDVPLSKLEKFSSLGSTFLVKRFDRDKEKRIHFTSAMTMLKKTDGASAVDGTSYLDIANFIKANGAKPKKDILELWKRVVFNMAVSNTDDHLRNHGFILSKEGWELSPLFDVNPNPFGETLSLNVTYTDNRISINLLRELAITLGIAESEAEAYIKKILDIVQDNWKRLANEYGISKNSIKNMKTAFYLKY